MNILAVDTATSTLHLALYTTEGLDELMIEHFQHSEGMLEEIVKLLESRKLEIKDLDLLVCTRGPGSFTSLRISMATLKGFSLACGIPLVSVPGLEAIARAFSIEGLVTVACIDAKKKRYYLGLYRDGEQITPDMDGNAENLVPYLEGEKTAVLTGPDAKAFAPRLQALLPDLKLIVDTENIRPLGHVLINMGTRQFEKAGPDDIGQGPVYIRRSDAEEALIQRQMKGDEK